MHFHGKIGYIVIYPRGNSTISPIFRWEILLWKNHSHYSCVFVCVCGGATKGKSYSLTVTANFISSNEHQMWYFHEM